MQVKVISSCDEFERYSAAIWELFQCSLYPNIFYSPDFLIPALKYLKKAESWKIILTYSNDDPSILTGLYPVEQSKQFVRLPLSHWSMLTHPFGIDGTALVRREFEQESLCMFLDWATNNLTRLLLDFPRIAHESPWQKYIQEYAAHKKLPLLYSDTFDRAVLTVRNNSTIKVSKKAQKDSRRKRTMLIKQYGEVSVEHYHHDPQHLDKILELYLEIESKGWKGRAGTAIKSHKSQELFFKESLTKLYRFEKVLISVLSTSQSCLAVRVSLIANSRLFCFKTAFNEEYALYSPGLILELEHLEHAISHYSVSYVDSYADPENQLFQRIFSERKAISSLYLGLNSHLSSLLIRAVSYGRGIKRNYKATRNKILTHIIHE